MWWFSVIYSDEYHITKRRILKKTAKRRIFTRKEKRSVLSLFETQFLPYQFDPNLHADMEELDPILDYTDVA